MKCKHPLKGFIVGQEDGKNVIKIASQLDDHMELTSDGQYVPSQSPFISPRAVKVFHDFVDIPCKKCTECRLTYAKSWSDRCMMESLYHDESWFVTLTYDDSHLPSHDVVQVDTGEMLTMHSLSKRDWQLFMKKLRIEYVRKRLKHGIPAEYSKIRFFMAGEYGAKGFRPHYHAILFGLHLDDLIEKGRNSQGDILYVSPWLNKIWAKGFVIIGKVTPQSCNYVARYVVKKQLGREAKWYDEVGMTREFTLMSRNPGIGRQYYEDHKHEIYEYDYMSVPTDKGGIKVYPPKYFDRLLEVDNPEEFNKRIEWRNRVLKSDKDMLDCQSSKDYYDMLQDEEQNALARQKIILERSL